MARIFNKIIEKEKRRYLRNNSTKTEKLVWQYLRRRHVMGYKFRRQYGVYQFVLDFYCPELKLAIEIDGPTHIGEDAQKYDEYRQNKIEELGIVFLRFTNEEVYSKLDWVIEEVGRKVTQLTTPKPPPKIGGGPRGRSSE